jgi:hypothetical protein
MKITYIHSTIKFIKENNNNMSEILWQTYLFHFWYNIDQRNSQMGFLLLTRTLHDWLTNCYLLISKLSTEAAGRGGWPPQIFEPSATLDFLL